MQAMMLMRPAKAISGVILALWAASSAMPPAADAEGAQSPVLIELFTAEGCSSCPPADAFLRQLDASQPIAGAQLIVLGEHVDYWDQQGWPDPFSSASLTDRQRGYVRALRLREPYTPQFIVDGDTEMRLSERQKIAKLLESAAASPKIPVAIASLQVEPGPPAIASGVIEIDGTTERHKSEIYLALALDHFESKVLRGENRGQSLAHVAVVIDIAKVGSLRPGQTLKQDFRVPLRAGVDLANIRAIAFVQESDYGKVVGAALKRTASNPG
jgi:hypothetical protein